MQHGDLSNTPAPKVGIRFEEIIRKEENGTLNRSGKAFVEQLVHLDVSIVLFTTGNWRRCAAFCYKWGVAYSSICAVDSVLDLVKVCQEQSLLQYWDTDKDILSKVKERDYRNTEVKLWTLQDNSYLE